MLLERLPRYLVPPYHRLRRVTNTADSTRKWTKRFGGNHVTEGLKYLPQTPTELRWPRRSPMSWKPRTSMPPRAFADGSRQHRGAAGGAGRAPSWIALWARLMVEHTIQNSRRPLTSMPHGGNSGQRCWRADPRCYQHSLALTRRRPRRLLQTEVIRLPSDRSGERLDASWPRSSTDTRCCGAGSTGMRWPCRTTENGHFSEVWVSG